MHDQTILPDEYISLTQVAKLAPGRLSTNCVWRWCRRGVKSRTGDRVHLQHVRLGGMIYSTREWLNDFGRQLAEADARYFERCDAAESGASSGRRRRERSPSKEEEARRKEIEDVDRELARAGI